jgi:exodeoxyribonuclease VII large subunit
MAGRHSGLAQRFAALPRRLEARDVHRVVATLRTRIVAADGRLAAALGRRRQSASARAATLAARLDALSPLAVLARGYAVCWNAERTSIIRSATSVATGETVHVRLADGELTCEVREQATGHGRQAADDRPK